MLNIGDTVELKSGGPVMTIDRRSLVPGKVWCSWFDSNNQRQEREFDITSLKPARPGAKDTGEAPASPQP